MYHFQRKSAPGRDEEFCRLVKNCKNSIFYGELSPCSGVLQNRVKLPPRGERGKSHSDALFWLQVFICTLRHHHPESVVTKPIWYHPPMPHLLAPVLSSGTTWMVQTLAPWTCSFRAVPVCHLDRSGLNLVTKEMFGRLQEKQSHLPRHFRCVLL